MDTHIDVERIMRMIPHRYPFLMIDKVVKVDPGKYALGIKNVTINENFFMGHFPKKPIMPGVLIIEAMAQTSAVVVVESLGAEDQDHLVYFMSIDGARFRKPVFPGDVLELHVTTVQSRRNVWKFDAQAIVDGNKVAEATISAMITDGKDA